MGYLETINLCFNHSLIMGHAPKKLKLEHISNKLAKEGRSRKIMQSFGLFDRNQANYNTYYPDVKAADLVPKDEDFVQPVFRALSEVVVHREWNPVDFSMSGVLRKSMGLLKGSTVKTDHDDGVGNSIGAVAGVEWEMSRKHNGILVPAGINARMKIDGKSHPRIARAIMMDPPAIHSDSVTVQFMWEKSHSSLSEEEFFRKLGSFDESGELIRRIATSIKKYPEVSLVDHGADPFAQVKDDKGNIINPQYAKSSMSAKAKAELKREQKSFFFDFKSDIIANKEKTTIPLKINNNSQTTEMNKELIVLLALHLGIKINADKPNLKLIKSKLREIKKAGKDATQLQADLKALQESTATKDEQIKKLKEFRKATVASLRKETIRNYNLLCQSSGGDVEESVITLLNTAKPEALAGLNKDYQKKLEKSYPLVCNSCGSDEVSRASSVSEGESKKTRKLLTNSDEILDKVQKKQTRKALKQMHAA